MDNLMAMFMPRPEDDQPRGSTILPEAAIMELRAVQADFIKSGTCRFAIGDLVIPKKNGLISRDDELPRVIIEVNADAPYSFESDPRSAHFGMRFDIRVLGFNEGNVIAFWAESSYFEPYTGEAADGTPDSGL